MSCAAAFIFLKIKADLAEALLEQMFRALSPLFLAFLPDSDCLRTGSTCEERMAMLIPEEPMLLIFFCLQAAAAPAFTSSLFTTIRSPKTYLLVPLDALLILAFMLIPFFLLLDYRRISLVIFKLV